MTEDGDSSRTVLLISDCVPTEPGGRAEKLSTRQHLLAKRGWELVVCPVREPYIRTFPRSVVRGIQLARKHDADVVHSINNPFHLHVIGFFVSVFCGLPWLAELRDALVTDPDLDEGSPRYYARRFVEWLIVNQATKVAWIDGIQLPPKYFETRYPERIEHVVRLPFMGFLPDHFEGVTPEIYESFTITYAGSFYPGWIEPFAFIDGLRRYVETTGQEDVRVQFYGDWREEYQEYAESSGVASAIYPHEVVPHDQIRPVLKGSDVVLHIGGDDARNERNIPSKIWDYVGARRPILAVVDPSFRAAEFIRQNNFGVVASPDDPDEIADAIRRLRNGSCDGPEETTYEQFSRVQMADMLEETLDAAWKKKRV